MPMASRTVSLGGAELRRLRHVCAVFDGMTDKATVVDRFIVDGLSAGERVVHVVESRDADLERLGRVVDVSAAVVSGQLDVLSWDESYVAGGRFNASKMLLLMRRWLRDGQANGFRATRLIGDMGWARAGVAGVNELATYEREVGALVARPLLSVVCAYDHQHHTAAQIGEVVPLHQAALVEGRLHLPPSGVHSAGPRARIMDAAGVLFADHGIARTGVDALIDGAGVAKATFYRHFPSKDALIAAWLRDPRTRWFDRVRAQVEAESPEPDEVIPLLFDAIADWLEGGDFVGCPYLNTSVEISDPGHPASDLVRAYLAEIGAYLEACVVATGHEDAADLGREVHALLAGAIALGAANRTSSFVMAARDAAVELLTDHHP